MRSVNCRQRMSGRTVRFTTVLPSRIEAEALEPRDSW